MGGDHLQVRRRREGLDRSAVRPQRAAEKPAFHKALRAVSRLVAALALCASGCVLREPRTSGQPCSTNDQCDSSVCFLGECRAASAALAVVHAEVRSADSQYGTLQSSAIDPRRTPVADFTLRPLLTVSGRVMQQADPPGTGTV